LSKLTNSNRKIDLTKKKLDKTRNFYQIIGIKREKECLSYQEIRRKSTLIIKEKID
jgi:hypothetical protein